MLHAVVTLSQPAPKPLLGCSCCCYCGAELLHARKLPPTYLTAWCLPLHSNHRRQPCLVSLLSYSFSSPSPRKVPLDLHLVLSSSLFLSSRLFSFTLSPSCCLVHTTCHRVHSPIDRLAPIHSTVPSTTHLSSSLPLSTPTPCQPVVPSIDHHQQPLSSKSTPACRDYLSSFLLKETSVIYAPASLPRPYPSSHSN